IGGRDLQAGGTWLAVAPEARRGGPRLNGRGRGAPEGSRRTPGGLPVPGAGDRQLAPARPAHLGPLPAPCAAAGRGGVVGRGGGAAGRAGAGARRARGGEQRAGQRREPGGDGGGGGREPRP